VFDRSRLIGLRNAFPTDSRAKMEQIKGNEGFCLKAKARTWPWLSCTCHIRLIVDLSGGELQRFAIAVVSVQKCTPFLTTVWPQLGSFFTSCVFDLFRWTGWLREIWLNANRHAKLISQKLFMQSFSTGQFPDIQNKLMDLCTNWLVQNDFMDTYCKIKALLWRLAPSRLAWRDDWPLFRFRDGWRSTRFRSPVWPDPVPSCFWGTMHEGHLRCCWTWPCVVSSAPYRATSLVRKRPPP